jgi:hypothetical protein
MLLFEAFYGITSSNYWLPRLLFSLLVLLLLLFNLILSSYNTGCLRGGKSAFYYVSLLSFGGSDYDNRYPP